jgi:hypothetical protein
MNLCSFRSVRFLYRVTCVRLVCKTSMIRCFYHKAETVNFKGGYTIVTLSRIVTPYRDSVDGTRARIDIKSWLRGNVTSVYPPNSSARNTRLILPNDSYTNY